MAVKIILRRRIPPDKLERAERLLNLLRGTAAKQTGYFYGESLRSGEDPDQHIVISTWQSMGCWRTWEASAERRQIQARLDDLLGNPTRYDVYCHLAPLAAGTLKEDCFDAAAGPWPADRKSVLQAHYDR